MAHGEFRRRARLFFTNWRTSNLPLPERLRVTARNRLRALRRGCCGNPGEPGC
ncbi:MAG TPA: hypothetical protein VNP94_10440 [Actinomycetota bacterium]|nr:hypothetical protein [Actinomycetota bacterium]